jgi:hypothetical protein
MIVGLSILVLAAVSVHVRRFVNGVALFIVCAIVWLFMFVAIPLESPSRVWRLVGLGALAAALLTFWAAADLALRAIRHLP